MSTLNVSNITDGTTTVGTSYVVNGSAKAWANLNGTGTIALRDTLNTSSATDNSAGNFTFSFTSSMSSDQYHVVAGVTNRSDASSASHSVGYHSALTTGQDYIAHTASSIRLRNAGSNGTSYDVGSIGPVVFGELA